MFNTIDYLTGFGIMLLQLLVISASGAWVGIKIARLFERSSYWSQSVVRLLRIGIWVPFVVYWPLQIWPARDGYHNDPIFWAWLTCFVVVTLSASYHYLTVELNVNLAWKDSRPYVIRATTLHALFISLISQFWVFPHGWNWFFLQAQGEVLRLCASLILVLTILFAIDRFFKSNFIGSAEMRATILTKEVTSVNSHSLTGTLVFVILPIVLWQLLSKPIKLHLHISSPVEVVEALYRLLTFSIAVPHISSSLWWHVLVSLIEVFCGLALAGTMAVLVYHALRASADVRRSLLSLLPLTYISPIILPHFVISWVGDYTGPWRIVLGIGLLCFFPMIEALWGLRAMAFRYRIALALDYALPFAIVGMILGETVNAVAGVGVFMAVAHATGRVADGLAVGLVTLVLMIVLSVTIRSVVRRGLVNVS